MATKANRQKEKKQSEKDRAMDNFIEMKAAVKAENNLPSRNSPRNGQNDRKHKDIF